MDSTPTERSTGQSAPPTLEELTRRTARMMIIPSIIGYVARMAPPLQSRNVIVIVNPRTWAMTMIEGAVDLETFLAEKFGPLPASKASIEAMPMVKVEEEGKECAICLAEFEVGGEAKEMPCKHSFHSACIEKWLRMRGSCPLCRYSMPVEENKTEGENDAANDDGEVEAEAIAESQHEEEEEMVEAEEDGRAPTYVFHVYYAGRRLRRRRRYSDTEMDPSWNYSLGGAAGDGNSGTSAQDMEIDSEPTAQDMDTD